MNTNLPGVKYTPQTSSLVIPPRQMGQGGIEAKIVNRDGSAVITAADVVADQRLAQVAAILSEPLADDREVLLLSVNEMRRVKTFAARYGMTVEEAVNG